MLEFTPYIQTNKQTLPHNTSMYSIDKTEQRIIKDNNVSAKLILPVLLLTTRPLSPHLAPFRNNVDTINEHIENENHQKNSRSD